MFGGSRPELMRLLLLRHPCRGPFAQKPGIPGKSRPMADCWGVRVKVLGEILTCSLADSRSEQRKLWAAEVVERNIPVVSLLSIFDSGDQTAQRFMWLLGDVCERDPDRIAECLPILFSLRNEMPFPGMPRSVAKWLMLTGVPEELEPAASRQLLKWIRNPDSSIACKSYSARAVISLVKSNRLGTARVRSALATQLDHENRSYANRIRKLIERLD